jgi:hypothetical protein
MPGAACHDGDRRGVLSTRVDAEELIRQASESIRSALDAAQRRADEIVREAEAEAQRIRSRAETEARERLDEVREALERLEAGLTGAAAPPAPAPESAPKAAAAEPEPRKPPEEPKAPGPEPQPEPPRKATIEAPNADAGAARLVAMKLALDGTPRDEARAQLAADYDLADLDALLEEVYAKAGK